MKPKPQSYLVVSLLQLSNPFVRIPKMMRLMWSALSASSGVNIDAKRMTKRSLPRKSVLLIPDRLSDLIAIGSGSPSDLSHSNILTSHIPFTTTTTNKANYY